MSKQAETFEKEFEDAYQNANISPRQFLSDLVEEDILTDDDIVNAIVDAAKHPDSCQLVVHQMTELLRTKLNPQYVPNWEPEELQ